MVVVGVDVVFVGFSGLMSYGWTDVLWLDFAEMHRPTKNNEMRSPASRFNWLPISEHDGNVALAIVARRCPRRTLRELMSADMFMKRGSRKVTCCIMI